MREPPKRERAAVRLHKTRRKANSRNGFGFWCQRAHPSLDHRHSVAFRRYTTTLRRGALLPRGRLETPLRDARCLPGPSSPSNDYTPNAVDETKKQNLILVAELLHDRHITPRPPRVQRDSALEDRQLQPQEDDDVGVIPERHV